MYFPAKRFGEAGKIHKKKLCLKKKSKPQRSWWGYNRDCGVGVAEGRFWAGLTSTLSKGGRPGDKLGARNDCGWFLSKSGREEP